MAQMDELIKKAKEAMAKAYSPYSHFKVGAAVLTKSGKIYTGCNIENCSYGLTICAERVAIFNAVSSGEREFDAIAIVTDSTELTPPCGACRQVIWEFSKDVVVLLTNLQGKQKTTKISDLLPIPFDKDYLK
ncbi:MAG TPA: cytidine deaminase [Candidatus Brocadiia bacterium]